MTKQITLEELLDLVSVEQNSYGYWRIVDVKGTVYGNVEGDVGGYVSGTINAREWEYVETPKDKLKRLIEEGADKGQLLEAFNELDNN